ncbi:hypothetical protein CRG98_008194 [Punica granatum]|uniref:Uncharacterized protein n=1 Tax=Punica granatum TaxID=22663 RepID=A0A2I0KSG5_PUNGR|nr:hypothetical protein CRG98_008194 [Punica granatum]
MGPRRLAHRAPHTHPHILRGASQYVLYRNHKLRIDDVYGPDSNFALLLDSHPFVTIKASSPSLSPLSFVKFPVYRRGAVFFFFVCVSFFLLILLLLLLFTLFHG